MDIKLHKITVRELTKGYADNNDDGVIAYDGKLDVRPPFQREFVYKDKQRDAVIRTLIRGFPLNVMYWATREDKTFEIIDGQQRTISICQYVNGDFSYSNRYFHNLQPDEQEQIYNYELQVYICSGTESEKLEWFRTINIAGEKLEDQELRNAVYAGSWVSDAKRYFSKKNCAAVKIGSDYLLGDANRQAYLETAISWISDGRIDDYMGIHQHDTSAVELWNYFNNIINWIKAVFPIHRNEMKKVDWGTIYKKYHNNQYDSNQLEKIVKRLMADSDIQKKSGIYTYVFDGDEHSLNIRTFDSNMKREVYERQNGLCSICHKHFDFEFMEGDHITPWREGGRTVQENCQMLCRECNRRKGAK